jgi:hypothetical protein
VGLGWKLAPSQSSTPPATSLPQCLCACTILLLPPVDLTTQSFCTTTPNNTAPWDTAADPQLYYPSGNFKVRGQPIMEHSKAPAALP